MCQRADSFMCMCRWVPFKKCRAKLLEENCNYPAFSVKGTSH